MGLSNSKSVSEACDKSTHLLRWYQQVAAAKGITGGGKGEEFTFPGSLGELGSQRFAIYNEAKEKLIRELYKGLKQELNFKLGDDDDLDKIVADLEETLPKPGKKTIKEKKLQDSVIDKVAKIVARITGTTLEGSTAEEKYRYITQVLYSIFYGLHYEFFIGKSLVEDTLSKCKLCLSELDSYNKRLQQLAMASRSKDTTSEQLESIKMENQQILSIVEKITQIFNNTLVRLESLLNTQIRPVEETIEKYYKSTNPEDKFLASTDISSRGDAIVGRIINVGNAAMLAKVVRDAMTKIGVTVKDVLSADNKRELAAKLEELKVKSKPETVGALAKNIQVILDNFDQIHREDVKESLMNGKQVTGQAEESEMTDDMTDNVTGGATTSLIKKKVERFDQEKNAVLSQFNMQMDYYFGQINALLAKISRRLGPEGSLESNDKVGEFIKALNQIVDLNITNIYYAISGYSRDIDSTKRREEFLSSLKYVLVTLEPLESGSSGDLFKSLSSVIRSTIDYVNANYKVFDNKFSLDTKPTLGGAFTDMLNNVTDKVHQLTEAANKVKDDVHDIVDVGKDMKNMVKGAAEPPRISKNVFDFGTNKKNLEAFYRIGKFKKNLSMVTKENVTFTEENTKLLGMSMGKKKEDIRIEKERILENLNKDTYSGYTDADSQKKLIKTWVDLVYKTKMDFYSTLEQIEIILGNFIDAITKQPDAIKDLRTIVDSLLTTNNWFESKLGDSLCKLFELCRQYSEADGKAPDSAKDVTKDWKTGEHYYQFVESLINPPANSNVGDPYRGISITDTNMEKLNKIMDSIASELNVVTNLLSIFRRIGDKFGGVNVMKDMSMSVTVISQNIRTFIIVSAFVGDYEFVNKGGEAGPISGSLPPGPAPPAAPPVYTNIDNNGTPLTADYKKERYTPILASVGNETSSLNPKLTFKTEQTLFVMMFKGMIAKVFTTIGVYDTFERPLMSSKTMNSTRMVLGGAHGHKFKYISGKKTLGGASTPKIYEELIDLYRQLMLLSEQYREILSTDNLSGKAKGIAFIPDIDGTFSRLVELMFIRFYYITNGDYSETDVKQYIEEVNNIYETYLSREKNVSPNKILEDYILEINRRYGVVTQDEIDSVKKLRSPTNPDADFYNATMSSRLLDDDDDIVANKLLPSSMYYGNLGNIQYKGEDIDSPDFLAAYTLVKEFRDKLNSHMMKVDANNKNTLYSFDQTTNQVRYELKGSSSEEERFRVVYRYLTMSDKYSKGNSNKYIMFHETILMGLSLLTSLKNYLTNFKKNISITDAYDDLRKLFSGEKIKKSDGTDLEITNAIALQTAYEDLRTKYLSVFTPVGDVVIENGRYGAPSDIKIIENAEAATMALDANNKFNIQFGLLGLLHGKDIKQSINTPEFNFIEPFLYRPRLIAIFIETLLDHININGELVNIKVMEDGIRVDYGQMLSFVEELISNLKTDLEKFRGTIDNDRYKDTLNSIIVIDNEIHELISPRDQKNIKLNEFVNKQFKVLYDLYSRNLKSDATGLRNAGAVSTTHAVQEMYVAKYGQFAEILDIDPVDRFFHLNGGPITTNSVGTNSSSPIKLSRATTGYDVLSTLNSHGVFNDISMGYEYGFIPRFNQLLWNYIKLFYDGNSIYLPLLDVANNSFNAAIFSDKCINDITDAARNKLDDGDKLSLLDPSGNVIYRSIAGVIRALMTEEKQNVGGKRYLNNDLSTVPTFMKEMYRRYLPLFVKMFDLDIKKLEELRKIAKIFKQNIRTNHNNSGQKYGTGVANVAGSDDKLSGIYDVNIDSLIQAYYALRLCCTNVLKELDDKPKYFETHLDSITDYKNLNRKLQFMPLSIQLAGLKTVEPWRVALDNSSEVQSILYGTRGILNNPPSQMTYEQIPGVRTILDTFNSSVDTKSMFDADKYLSLMRQYQSIIQYLMNVHNCGLKVNMVVDMNDIKNKKVETFSMSKDHLVESIRLVESVSQDDAKDEMANFVINGGTVNKFDRDNLRMLNVIDMNIMPINIHALRKSFPLINTMNMALTFDQMLTELFNVAPLDKINDSKSFEEFLCSFMSNPHDEINEETYENYVTKLFRGNTGTKLVQPRFLANEIFNKSMLDELYRSKERDVSPSFTTEINNTYGKSLTGISLMLFPPLLGEITSADEGYGDIMTEDNLRKLISNNKELLTKYIEKHQNMNGLYKDLVIDDANLTANNTNEKKAVLKTMFVFATLAIKNIIAKKLYITPDVAGALDIAKSIVGTNLVPDASYGAHFTNKNGILYIELLKDIKTAPLIGGNPKGGDAAINASKLKKCLQDIAESLSGKSANMNNNNTTSLHYPEKEADQDIYKVSSVDVKDKYTLLRKVGKKRFDTYLVRDIVFLSNMYRIIRYKIDQEVKWFNPEELVRSYSSLNDSLTERYGNETDKN